MTQQRISAYEKGKREPDIETLKQFASFFNISINYLLGISSIKNPKKIKQELEDLKKIYSDSHSSQVISYYNKLNELGKKKATENIKDLTKILEYTEKKEKSQEA